MQTRKPYVAGQFYPDTESELRKTIEECFQLDLGPGLPTKNKQKVVGAIIPHAGYTYSGACAAHAWRAIAESGPFDIYILMGFNHRGMDEAKISTDDKDWETPLGVAKADRSTIKHLLKDTRVVKNPYSIENEHSIEVQVPFLQYINPKAKIVPLSVSGYADFKEMAKEINIALGKKNVCFIASSDFTHYGRNFSYIPFKKNIQDNLRKLDMDAIEFIKKLDTEGFRKYVERTGATICGQAPISLLLELLKGHARKGKVLKYYTSGELTEDFTSSVSYASIVFDKKMWLL
jgi:AmmeMemoRadiSam system protein B